MSDILIAIISGGAVVAVIEGVREYLTWRRNRRATLEDRQDRQIEKRLEKIEAESEAQSEALKFILYDRIRYLGQAYIAEGEIDFDDRRVLNDIHRSYHEGLHGNGYLDTLMAEVNRLPLKIRTT